MWWLKQKRRIANGTGGRQGLAQRSAVRMSAGRPRLTCLLLPYPPRRRSRKASSVTGRIAVIESKCLSASVSRPLGHSKFPWLSLRCREGQYGLPTRRQTTSEDGHGVSSTFGSSRVISTRTRRRSYTRWCPCLFCHASPIVCPVKTTRGTVRPQCRYFTKLRTGDCPTSRSVSLAIHSWRIVQYRCTAGRSYDCFAHAAYDWLLPTHESARCSHCTSGSHSIHNPKYACRIPECFSWFHSPGPRAQQPVQRFPSNTRALAGTGRESRRSFFLH